MDLNQVSELHPGDEVFWNDPDEGSCSRIIKIQSIRVNGEIVILTDEDGSTLECFADELA